MPSGPAGRTVPAGARGEEAGRFGRVIQASKKQGVEPPGIYYLFAGRPEATPHLCNFMHEVMRGPSDLSAGQRELIAALGFSADQLPEAEREKEVGFTRHGDRLNR